MPNSNLVFPEHDKGGKMMCFRQDLNLPFHGFSTTMAGNMSLKWEKTPGEASKNVAAFFTLLGISAESRVHMIPGDGSQVLAVTEQNIWDRVFRSHGPLVCDGLITRMLGVPFTVCPADCYPVILGSADPNQRFCALLHVGKKSWQCGIVNAGLAAAHEIGGVQKPNQIVAGIGPGIGPCCYHMDLRTEIQKQLRSHGLPDENIWSDKSICTCCSTFDSILPSQEEGNKLHVFQSHRRDSGTGHEERFLATACL